MGSIEKTEEKIIEIPDWRKIDLDSVDNWERYVGSIWKNIFILSDLPKEGIVVEVAPGITNKIEYGLAGFGFKGVVYIIEPDSHCIEIIREKYKKSLPECKIIFIQKKLDEAIDFLPEKVDAIVANHPLDDMILGDFLDSHEFSDYFGEKFGTNSEKTKFLWEKIAKDREFLEKSKLKLVSAWKKLIEKSNPGFVAVSQYVSYYFRRNGILAPDDNALDVLTRIREIYSKYDNKKIISRIETYDADMVHWFVLDFRGKKN